MTRQTRMVIPLLSTGLLVAACHHSLQAPAPAPSRTTPSAAATPAVPRAAVPAPPAPVRAPAPLTEDEIFRRKSLDALNAEQPLSDAFFDYNQNTLRDDARAALQRDAEWLSKWQQTRIVVEGHCDERGTAEYNLGLGEERAAAVRNYLTSLGVRADRVVTKSLGKEAPFCQGSDESCWSQNRRGHFVITAK